MTTAPLPSGRRSLPARLHLATWRGKFAWFGGLLLLIVLVCWLLMRSTPAWYRPLDPDNDKVIELSTRAQNNFLDLRNTVERTPLGDQAWTISQDEVNSYLAIRTGGTLNPDGTRSLPSDRISSPVVVFEPGVVSLSARIREIPSGDPRGGVGTLTFSVDVDNSTGKPMGRVKLIGAKAGYMPVPLSVVEKKFRDNLPGIVDALQKVAELELRGHGTPVMEDALAKAAAGELFPLDYRYDRKDFTIKELRVDQGRFSIVLTPRRAATTATMPMPPATLPATTTSLPWLPGPPTTTP